MTSRVHRNELPRAGERSHVFQGSNHGANVSFFLIDSDPGEGPPLHAHPYEEVFVVETGKATFTVGDDTIEAHAGHILIAPPGIPHRFVNSGRDRLQTVNIHPSAEMITEWMEPGA